LEGHSPFDRTRQKLRSAIKAYGKGEVLLTPFEGSSIIVEIKEGNRNSTLTSLAEP